LKVYLEETAIENMEMVEVTLDMCTLYKGVPYGLAFISCTHPLLPNFKGIGVFNEGKLTGAPFTCINSGWGISFSKMENGRPADNSYFTTFSPNGCKEHVESLKYKTDVSGW
jgi:hypothetical protein